MGCFLVSFEHHVFLLFFCDEFADFVGQISRVKLVAKLNADLETLREVDHVHVGENFFVVFGDDAHSHSVKQKLVNFFFFGLDVTGAQY